MPAFAGNLAAGKTIDTAGCSSQWTRPPVDTSPLRASSPEARLATLLYHRASSRVHTSLLPLAHQPAPASRVGRLTPPQPRAEGTRRALLELRGPSREAELQFCTPLPVRRSRGLTLMLARP